MKKYLSARLIIFTMKESWLPFAIVSAFGIILSMIVNSISFAFSESVMILNIVSITPALKAIPLLLVPFTVKAFGFYMKRCEADFYESLPYTRNQVLFSVTGALSLLSVATLSVILLGSYLASLEYISSHVFLVGDSISLFFALILLDS